MMNSDEERLTLTGQLGDVMKESAMAALTYVRSNAESLGIDPHIFENKAIHIHVPEGAIPKDGPSAGVTMMTAIASLAMGRKARSDLAMTGEISLRGKVLPIGGLKEKALAAHRAGIRTVIIPKRNEFDLDDLPGGIARRDDVHPGGRRARGAGERAGAPGKAQVARPDDRRAPGWLRHASSLRLKAKIVDQVKERAGEWS